MRDRDQRETEQRRADLGLGKVTNHEPAFPEPGAGDEEGKKPASQPEAQRMRQTPIRIDGEVGEEGVT